MTPLLCAPVIAGLLPAGKPQKVTRPQTLKRLQANGLVTTFYNFQRHYTGEDADVNYLTIYAPHPTTRLQLADITTHVNVVLKSGFYPHEIKISRAFLSDNGITGYTLAFSA